MLSSYDEPSSYVNNIEHSVCLVPSETICCNENVVENGGECEVVLFPSSETEMLPIIDSDNVNTIDDVDKIHCGTESVSVGDSSTVDGVEQVHGSSSGNRSDANDTCPNSSTVNSIDRSDAVVNENLMVTNDEQTDESHVSADIDASATEFQITSAPSVEECPDIHASSVTSTEDESVDSCNGIGIACPSSPSASNAQSLDNNQDETTESCVTDDANVQSPVQSKDVVVTVKPATLSAIPLLSIPQSLYDVDHENATEFSILPSPRSKSDGGGGGAHSPSVSALSNTKLEVFTLQSAVAAGGLSEATDAAVEEAERCCEADADPDPLKDEPVVATTVNVENVSDSPNMSASKTQLSLKSESSDNATTGSESFTDVVRPFKKTESMLPLGEAIVQSVLYDDDDDEDGTTKVDGIHSPRRPLSGISLSAEVSNAGGVKIVPSQSLDAVSCSSVDANLENVDLDGGGFVEINLHSSGGSDRFENLAESLQNSETTPTRSAGLSAFLSRLSRKPDAAAASESPPGWKLFGRVPPKDAPNKTSDDVSQDIKSKQSQNSVPSPSHAANKQNSNSSSKPVEPALDPTSVQAEAPGSQRSEKETPKSGWFRLTSSRRNNREVPSTTALILEQRPGGLPMKSPEEALRHQMMYDEMVEAARKKEQKDLKLRKKQRERQMKYEEQMSNALRVWNTQILPCWDTAKGSKKAQELWWNGLPPSIRGKVWTLAIGNDLNVTADLYEICLVRAKDKLRILQDADSDSLSSYSESPGNRESSVELIKLDVSRTFPQLCIFQHGGPYHQTLQGLLGAYACYRPDVGYVQGMSFLAAVLLLNMDAVDTFICFANLLNKPCQVAFFRLDESSMKAYFETYEVFFQENMPQLFAHFKTLELSPDIYIIDWMYTLFAKSLPLDVASRVWDVYCRDGEEFLFRTALGILRMHRDILLRLDFIHLAQFLTRLPDTISALELFDNIAQIHMIIDKQRFAQVLASKRDR